MYKYKPLSKNRLTGIQTYEGESIEAKVRRIVNNKEPITDGAPIIYTDRKDGVRPEHNIKTDRFEIAVDAMDKVSKSRRAKREQTIGEKAKEGMAKESPTENKNTGDAGSESIQATT